MNNLEDLIKIKNLDTKNALKSIKKLPQQIKQAWQESMAINFPQNFKTVSNIVISGMGGSTYGARIVKSLYDGAQMTKIPVELANTYWLPGYVNSDSLVILSSYSGNTEETLATAKEAKEREVKIAGITSGGQLADFLRLNNYPAYIFNPIHNPSAQPRIGVGYMVTGLLGMLAKLGYIPVGKEEIAEATDFLDNKIKFYEPSNSSENNLAKKLAHTCMNKIPVIIITDFLEGTAYAIRNPFHETAKQFALYFAVPELNHHLMEGLSYPPEIKDLLHFIFIDSKIYDSRNARRMQLTKSVIEKNKISFESIQLTGKTSLTQVMELIQLASWTTFYLAMLHDIDPSAIPWVDYFKKELSKIIN
ncbi:bifunctional phosphoglucose/phosphomannose isomerase [Candidatus Gottesmanbacteria bacterium]|nr:bifunctional phosphoglucose/phosphomannose isomerase [Candidatus Gottesmanbacteria bacterium]